MGEIVYCCIFKSKAFLQLESVIMSVTAESSDRNFSHCPFDSDFAL